MGLEKDMMEIVRQSVIRTIGRNQTVKGEMLPGVDNKLFKEELQKAFRAELKKPIQNGMEEQGIIKYQQRDMKLKALQII